MQVWTIPIAQPYLTEATRHVLGYAHRFHAWWIEMRSHSPYLPPLVAFSLKNDHKALLRPIWFCKQGHLPYTVSLPQNRRHIGRLTAEILPARFKF